MLPAWGAVEASMINVNKENLRNAPNAQSTGQTIIQPEEMFSEAREYEMRYKTLSFHTSKYMKSMLKIIHEVNNHGLWRGDDETLSVDSIHDKLLDMEDEYGLGKKLLLLFQNINGYIALSKETYAKQLLEIQLNHRKSMEESYSTNHLQQSKMMNDMKSTIEELRKDKNKLEQQLKTQKIQLEKQIKDLQDSKAALSADLEGKVKTLRHQLESATKAHKDELMKERSSVKEADDRLRQRSAELERKVTALARKSVRHPHFNKCSFVKILLGGLPISGGAHNCE